MNRHKLLLIILGILCLVIPVPFSLGDVEAQGQWVINGTSVYVDDSNAYLSATPHTLSGSGWVEFTLRSKVWSGDIDVVWGFPSGIGTRPKTPQRWALNASHQYQNVTIVSNPYTLEICNITTYNQLSWGSATPDIGNANNTLLFNVTALDWRCTGTVGNATTYIVACNNYTGNLSHLTVNGNRNVEQTQTYYEYYDDWVSGDPGPLQTVNYTYAGVDQWHIVKLDQSIQAGKTYTVRAWLDEPIRLGGWSAKYVWAVKPQTETISQARTNGHLYLLDPWLSGGWDKRVKLTTDQTDVDADLTNYPLLAYISAASGRNDDDVSFVFDELTSDANRKKIAVTTSDGETECKVEIENWNTTTEKAWLWIKAPSISGSTDQDFYLYFDKDHADNSNVGDVNSSPGGEVWTSDYKVVYHHNWASGSLIDSTSNSKDVGLSYGSMTAASGLTDGACDYSDDYWAGTNYFGANLDAFTYEAWVKPDVVTSDDGIIGASTGGIPQFAIYNSKWYIGTSVGGTSYGDYDQAMSTGTWQYIAWTYDNADDVMRYYYNGSQVDSDTTGGGTAQLNTNLYLGVYDTGAHLHFDGMIDEFRLSSASKSAASIKASYQAVSLDDLLDWGSLETAGAAGFAYCFGYIMGA